MNFVQYSQLSCGWGFTSLRDSRYYKGKKCKVVFIFEKCFCYIKNALGFYNAYVGCRKEVLNMLCAKRTKTFLLYYTICRISQKTIDKTIEKWYNVENRFSGGGTHFVSQQKIFYFGIGFPTGAVLRLGVLCFYASSLAACIFVLRKLPICKDRK